MKKRFLLCVLSALYCLYFPAAAQERLYTVTEIELMQLENISKNLRISRQKLQSQASSFTERLRVQESKAKTLTEKFTASRADSEQLKQSITDGAADIESLAAILHRIRARGNTANSESAGDN